MIDIVIKAAAGRVPVIAGTGSNSTHDAIEMTKYAEYAGAAASLQVTPYYNKPEQHGLIAHFEAVAKNTSLPIILYNIPGRTGRLIDVKTMLELAKSDADRQAMRMLFARTEYGRPYFLPPDVPPVPILLPMMRSTSIARCLPAERIVTRKPLSGPWDSMASTTVRA